MDRYWLVTDEGLRFKIFSGLEKRSKMILQARRKLLDMGFEVHKLLERNTSINWRITGFTVMNFSTFPYKKDFLKKEFPFLIPKKRTAVHKLLEPYTDTLIQEVEAETGFKRFHESGPMAFYSMGMEIVTVSDRREIILSTGAPQQTEMGFCKRISDILLEAMRDESKNKNQ